jgi:hypothetical protein
MRIALMLPLLAACSVDRPTDGVPIVESHGAWSMEFPDPAPTPVDILFVIDSSPAAATYQEQIRDSLQNVALLPGRVAARLDLHIGVITADLGDGSTDERIAVPGSCHGMGDAGLMRRSALVDGAFMTEHTTQAKNFINYQGDFTAALQSLSNVGTAGCAQTQPLEAIRRALRDPHNAGFVRDDAALAIVILAAQDDQSPGSVDDYRAFLRNLKADEDDVMVAVAGPDGASCGTADVPRLRSIAGERFATLCNEDVYDFVFRSACFPNYIPIPCLDANLVGEHPQCAVWDDGGAYPQCGDGVTGPCWRLENKPGYCDETSRAFILDRGELDPPARDNMVELQCATR